MAQFFTHLIAHSLCNRERGIKGGELENPQGLTGDKAKQNLEGLAGTHTRPISSF